MNQGLSQFVRCYVGRRCAGGESFSLFEDSSLSAKRYTHGRMEQALKDFQKNGGILPIDKEGIDEVDGVDRDGRVEQCGFRFFSRGDITKKC